MYRRILVPLDGSELAEAALPHARMMAQDTDAEIVLLLVMSIAPLIVPDHDPSLTEPCFEETRQMATGYLNRTAADLRDNRVKAWSLVKDGSPPETIVQVAEELGADVIVMSTHGRTGLARWLIGSVAERVAAGSNVPVMLIRPHQAAIRRR